MILLDAVRRRADEFDALHFHIDLIHMPLVQDFIGRCVTTLHGRLDLPDLPAFYRAFPDHSLVRSEEHTSELQSLMRISYAVFCLKKKKTTENRHITLLHDKQTYYYIEPDTPLTNNTTTTN